MEGCTEGMKHYSIDCRFVHFCHFANYIWMCFISFAVFSKIVFFVSVNYLKCNWWMVFMTVVNTCNMEKLTSIMPSLLDGFAFCQLHRALLLRMAQVRRTWRRDPVSKRSIKSIRVKDLPLEVYSLRMQIEILTWPFLALVPTVHFCKEGNPWYTPGSGRKSMKEVR